MEDLEKLVIELCSLPDETPWLEFKHDNYEPDMIGEDISALANSAALCDRDYAYMIWGISNESHDIIGTNYDLQSIKVGKGKVQELESWLRMLLSSNTEYSFKKVNINGKNIGILKIRRALSQTSAFKKVEFIRVGSYTKKLADVPAMRAQLWDKIRNTNFETMVCKSDLSDVQVLDLLDWEKYYDSIGDSLPSSPEKAIHYLVEDALVLRQDNGLLSITNLGGILLARKLSRFQNLSRKALRVVRYYSNNRAGSTKEYTSDVGYATGFEQILQYIEALMPSEDVISGAYRQTNYSYPPLALREALANALIHQDFSISGTGPVVEIFNDRIEITNPGVPLVRVERIIDNPPKSRNEKLASCMRRLKLCEELGTGWDKIVISCEAMNLPAPKIDTYDNSTRVILHAMMPFSHISYKDKLWACYLHACIKWVQGEHLTNSSLRSRFNLEPTYSSSISRLIKAAVDEEKYIKPFDSNTSHKHMSYIPFWA